MATLEPACPNCGEMMLDGRSHLNCQSRRERIASLERTVGEQADQIGGLTSELEKLRDVYTATAELLQIRKEQAQMLCGQLAKFYAELERARIDAEHMLDAYRDWNNEMAKVQDELARWKMRAHMAETNMRRVSQQLAEEREWHHEALASGQAISNERDALRQQLAASQAETRQVMDDYQDMGEEMGKLQAEAAALRLVLEREIFANLTPEDTWIQIGKRGLQALRTALATPSAAAERMRLLEEVAKWAKANDDAKTARTNYLLHGNAPAEMLAKIFEAAGKLRAALAALDAATEEDDTTTQRHVLRSVNRFGEGDWVTIEEKPSDV